MLYDVLWRVHAILMSTSFVAMFAGVLISLIYKKRKWRYKTHKRLGIYAGISGVTALITAFLMVQLSGGMHFSVRHAILGAITGLFLILTPIMGNRISKAKNKKQAKLIHRILGFITVLLMALTIFSGLSLVGIIYIG